MTYRNDLGAVGTDDQEALFRFLKEVGYFASANTTNINLVLLLKDDSDHSKSIVGWRNGELTLPFDIVAATERPRELVESISKTSSKPTTITLVRELIEKNRAFDQTSEVVGTAAQLCALGYQISPESVLHIVGDQNSSTEYFVKMTVVGSRLELTGFRPLKDHTQKERKPGRLGW